MALRANRGRLRLVEPGEAERPRPQGRARPRRTPRAAWPGQTPPATRPRGPAAAAVPRRRQPGAQLAALSDAQLVALGCKGEVAALEVLYRRHAAFAIHLAARIEGSSRDVEDIAHDAFVRAFERLDDLTDRAAFRSWLGAIVVHAVRSRMRRHRLMSVLGLGRSSEPVDLDALASPDASPHVRAQIAQIYALLRTLPTDERIAWILRCVEGHDLETVARMTRCSLATVKRRIARAQRFLDEHFVEADAASKARPRRCRRRGPALFFARLSPRGSTVMSRRSFPRIDPAALRDHADEARVERVWERIERDLASRPRAGAPRGSGAARSFAYVAVAAAFGAFGAGVLVGKATWAAAARGRGARRDPRHREEPGRGARGRHAAPHLPAARRRRAHALARRHGRAGARRQRAHARCSRARRRSTRPGARAGRRRRRGAHQHPGGQQVQRDAQRGGARRERRRTARWASALPPARSSSASGEHAAVPLHSPRRERGPEQAAAQPGGAAAAAERAHPDAKGPSGRSGSRGTTRTTTTARSPLLRKQDVGWLIATSKSASELNAIAELMRNGHDTARRSAPASASCRLSQGPARLPRGRPAPAIYEARGDARAPRSTRRSRSSWPERDDRLGRAPAATCSAREPDKTKAAVMAKEYLDKYPDGECRDEFEQMLPGRRPRSIGDPGAPPLAPEPASLRAQPQAPGPVAAP